ncbi:Lon protease-like, mitochondrial, partial [Fragariocoptes setiger]
MSLAKTSALVALAAKRCVLQGAYTAFSRPATLAINHTRNAGSQPQDTNAADTPGGAVIVSSGMTSGTDGLPSAFNVPDKWPIVPVIATKKPLFPLFYKEVIIQHPNLMNVIRRKIRLSQPYAGVFMKRDESNDAEIVDKIEDIHSVGTFVRIHGFRDAGHKIHMLVSAHRRIKLIRQVIEEVNDSAPDTTHLGRAKRFTKRNKIRFPRLRLTTSPSESEQESATAADNEESEENLDSGVSEESSEESEQIDTSSSSRVQALLTAEVENYCEESEPISDTVTALRQEIVQTIQDIMVLEPKYREHPALILQAGYLDADNPVHMADLGATIFGSTATDMQEVLEECNIEMRLNKTLMILKKCLEILKIQQKLRTKIDEDIAQRHRKYLLAEQLKLIKKELGLEKDDKDAVAERFRERIQGLQVPKNVMEIIDEELNKLSMLDSHSSEFSVIRNYLDLLTSLPWGKCTEENLDIAIARCILDEDHYGLLEVKTRILEFLAVSQLKGSAQGQILCLHGPPGVGKTSIAKSIAKALNREYYRFSVGGMSDVAEIKGHRRTYVGAMPGKLVQCLKRTKTENPLVLIDEIDKMGRGIQGDPSAALLELLDPEQNANFLDHYLDVPIDLSRVLFICTANYTETIPEPLKDRMDMIEVPGYKPEEKLAIAQRYLLPNKRAAAGISDDRLIVDDDVIREIINSYCKESGVRNLQKHIEKIMRKAALKIIEENLDKIHVTVENMREFVGEPLLVPGIGFTLEDEVKKLEAKIKA